MTVFREAAGTVDAHAGGVATQVSTTATAVAAMTAGDMTFAGDAIANFKVFLSLPDRCRPRPTHSCPTTIGTGWFFALQFQL